MPEYIRKPNTSCSVCHTKIYRRPCEIRRSDDHLFCSRACYGVSQRKEHPCTVCKRPILASANKKTCSRSCANGHRSGIRYRIGRPDDKVVCQRAIRTRLLRLRGSKCERCAYNDTIEILQVHHKDRDRSHNHPQNLELLCPNCHALEHYCSKKL